MNFISACLIWDQTGEPVVPERMLPAAEHPLAAFQQVTARDQLGGTAREVLCELAGRVCYDSLGKGRNSAEYHKHIAEVGHLSVWEHAVYTVAFTVGRAELARVALALANRPGVSFTVADGPTRLSATLRVTVNLRAVVEWPKWPQTRLADEPFPEWVWIGIQANGHLLAPAIVPLPKAQAGSINLQPGVSVCETEDDGTQWWHAVALATPVTDDERWVTLLLTGSRGMSHELVRHGDFTAISQRSTRYVDESESPYVRHPLIEHFMSETGGDLRGCSEEQRRRFSPWSFDGLQSRTADQDRETYRGIVQVLELWLVGRGIDKSSARKQARGAARGYLGNALYTEIVFSASIAQWKRILRQRASAFADAEIREVAVQAFSELIHTQYASCFEGWSVEPSPDGIGKIVVESA